MKSILLLAALLLPTVAFAQQAAAPSNFTVPYPAESCKKPYKPSAFKSNSEQQDFDNDVAKYLDCVKAYVDAANADIATIRAKATTAINRAKAQY